MSLTKRILYRLTNNRPLRVIDEDGRRYLERYFLFRVFGVRCYLHRFVGDDPGRGLHDHPWPWALSIILAGWYREHRRSGTRNVRWLNWLTGDTFHRVTLPRNAWQTLHRFQKHLPNATWNDYVEKMPTPREVGNDGTCWTLFIHQDKAVKPWGFWTIQEVWNPAGIKPEKKTEHQWHQFTYDNPEKFGSDEWWKDSARHPIAKHHPKRQPETLP
jgi:hypothetical protein